MEQIGGRAIHPINVRLGGFYSVPHKHDLEPLAEMLRRSLDDALDTLRSVAEFDFPDVEFDHELLSLADGERYPIENGTITRSPDRPSTSPSSATTSSRRRSNTPPRCTPHWTASVT